jgi:Spy/CpxP family protein refolding chaperone
MTKPHFAALALLAAVATSASALAQTPTAAQRAACKPDFDKFCAGTMPGGGRILACLNKQRDQLSDACKKALDTSKQ